VDKLVLRQDFSEYLGFPCQFSFHRLLHTHHLSSGSGTIGQLVADVPSGLCLTPSPKITLSMQWFSCLPAITYLFSRIHYFSRFLCTWKTILLASLHSYWFARVSGPCNPLLISSFPLSPCCRSEGARNHCAGEDQHQFSSKWVSSPCTSTKKIFARRSSEKLVNIS
jgi:hypothetical protein